MNSVKLICADPLELLRASRSSFSHIFANIDTSIIDLAEASGEMLTIPETASRVGRFIQAIESALLLNGSCFIVCNDEFAGEVICSAKALNMKLVNWLIVPFPGGEFQPNRDRFDFCKIHILWLSKGRHLFPAPDVTFVGKSPVYIPDELDGDVLSSSGYEEKIVAHSLGKEQVIDGRLLFLSARMDEFVVSAMKRKPDLLVVCDWRPEELENFSERMRELKQER